MYMTGMSVAMIAGNGCSRGTLIPWNTMVSGIEASMARTMPTSPRCHASSGDSATAASVAGTASNAAVATAQARRTHDGTADVLPSVGSCVF